MKPIFKNTLWLLALTCTLALSSSAIANESMTQEEMAQQIAEDEAIAKAEREVDEAEAKEQREQDEAKAKEKQEIAEAEAAEQRAEDEAQMHEKMQQIH